MRHPRGDARKSWSDTPARAAHRERLTGSYISEAWFRVYDQDGQYEDIAATLTESSGHRMKNRAYQLYNGIDVKAVVVLNSNKSKVIFSVRNMAKRPQKESPPDA